MNRTLGPWRIESEIGSGGMGCVYRAVASRDVAGLAAGTPVALKVVHAHLRGNDAFLERFRREAHVGLSVCHPNVVRTLDADVESTAEGSTPYLVMELVEGQTLRAFLDDSGPLPEPLARHVAREIAAGLAAIHAAGAIHRDLKPENVLITPAHAVKIMDLGVARLQDEMIRLSHTGHFLGSLAYTAPECVKGGDARVDGRTDLYSLGVVLYEVVAGHHPHVQDEVLALLQRILREKPRRLGEVNPQLSPFFEELVHTLLAKERSERFGSAAELLAILEEGERGAWWRERAQSLRRATRRPLRRVRITRETRLYGREEDLELLDGLFAQARRGRGQVLLLQGEAGIGKTRLVDEFVGRLLMAGERVHFLFGAHPPGGVSSASRALATAFREYFGDEDLEAQIAHRTSLSPQVRPVFAALLRGEIPPPPHQPLGQDAIQTVFAQALQALARDNPTVVLVEDLHFAPEDGRGLFSALALAVRDQPILLIGTLRPEGPGTWHAELERREHVHRHQLARLGARDLVALLADAFRSQSLAESLAGRIAVKSDGNPFFVFEIIRRLREDGVLQQSPDGTWKTTEVIREIQVPESVVELVNARVAELAREDRELLDVAACCGYEFDPLVVAEASGTDRLAALRRLGDVERRHRLVHSVGSRVTFDHHQVQETLYAGLMVPLREEYHAAIARSLERRARERQSAGTALEADDGVAIAEHYLRGRRGPEARPYLADALDVLERSCRVDQAGSLAQRALDLPGLLQGEERVGVLVRLGRVLDALGRRSEQEEVLREALDIVATVSNLELAAQAHRAYAWYHFALARYDDARREAVQALESARACGARAEEGHAASTLGGVATRLGELDEAQRQYERCGEIGRETGDRGLEAVSLGGIGNILYMRGRHEEACAHYENYRRVAQEIHDAASEASALGNLGTVLRFLGRYGEALEHTRRRLEIARERLDRRAECVASLNLAGILLTLGDVAASRQAVATTERALEEIGARREAALLLHLRGSTEEAEGNLALARRIYEEALHKKRELKDPLGVGHVLLSLAPLLAREGRLGEARAQLEEAIEIGRARGAPDLLVLASCHLAGLPEGRSGEARAMLARHGDRLGTSDRMEAHFRLWEVTGEVVYLSEAKRLLQSIREGVPAAYRTSLVQGRPLHRAIHEAGSAA